MRVAKEIATKERILKIALQEFIRKGYRETSLSQIAKQAGLTKGGIYHYFSSKDDLYYQILTDYFKNERRTRVFWLDQPSLRFKDLLWSGFASIEIQKKELQELIGSNDDDLILAFYSFLYEATRRYPEFQAVIDQYDQHKRGLLAAAIVKAQNSGEIREDLDAKMIALEFDLLLQQLQYLSFVNPTIKSEPEIFKQLFESYWLRLVK